MYLLQVMLTYGQEVELVYSKVEDQGRLLEGAGVQQDLVLARARYGLGDPRKKSGEQGRGVGEIQGILGVEVLGFLALILALILDNILIPC